MSGVLAVLDDLIADMGDLPGTTGHKVALVRDAVAELIEAAQEVIDGTVDAVFTYPDGPCIERKDRKRLISALANVTGGAA